MSTANLKLIGALIALLVLLGSGVGWAISSHTAILDKVDDKIEVKLDSNDQYFAKDRDMARIEEALNQQQDQINLIRSKVDKIYDIVNNMR